jgi:hypothetical protein
MGSNAGSGLGGGQGREEEAVSSKLEFALPDDAEAEAMITQMLEARLSSSSLRPRGSNASEGTDE